MKDVIGDIERIKAAKVIEGRNGVFYEDLDLDAGIYSIKFEDVKNVFVSRFSPSVFDSTSARNYNRIIRICALMDIVYDRIGAEALTAWQISRSLQDNAERFGERVYLPSARQAEVLAEACAKAWFARPWNVELFRLRVANG